MTAAWTFVETLDRALAHAARQRPEQGISILDRHGKRDSRCYPALLEAVHARAGRLAARGLHAGQVLLVALDTSWDWLESWLGAVELGAIPVAMAPGGGMGSGRAHLDKLDGLLQRLDAPLLVAGEAILGEAREHGLPRVLERHVTPAGLAALESAAFAPPSRTPEDIAFLQLTSGSTGAPRGVAIRHRSALHNTRAMGIGVKVDPDRAGSTQVVSWLPLHHDMGLVGCVLFCLVHGFDLDLIPPRQFLARPESWLAAIGARTNVLTAGPNFAYRACLERDTKARLEGTDLSSLTTGVTGAEMVRADTMRAFAQAHAHLGLDPRALQPCYGLAEGTLAVTFDQRRQGVRTAPLPGLAAGAEVVCVGEPLLDTSVRVTDDAGRTLPEHTIGQIRVAGPGVFAGYHRDPEATAEGLVEGELVTGDLGFLLDGELYITGRTKDLLIIRGHNLMPHEFEWPAENAVGGGGALRAGAFSIDGGELGELPVVIVETGATDPEELARQEREVRVQVGRELGLTLHDVVLVRRGRLPRTTSGKVRRGELRRMYLAGELEALHASPAETPRADPPDPAR